MHTAGAHEAVFLYTAEESHKHTLTQRRYSALSAAALFTTLCVCTVRMISYSSSTQRVYYYIYSYCLSLCVEIDALYLSSYHIFYKLSAAIMIEMRE